MRSVILVMLLVIGSLLLSQEIHAAETYGYTYAYFDDSTGTLSASSYTQADYSTNAYYNRVGVYVKIVDPVTRAELGYVSRETTGTYVSAGLQIAGSADQEYEVQGFHYLFETVYRSMYYYNGYYTSGYSDFYNYGRYEGQVPGPNGVAGFSFYGPGPEIISYNNLRRLGQTLAKVVPLELKNSGTIVAAPENEDYNDEVAVAGGIDQLGPLPLGQGRIDFQGTAYTSPIMVIGTIKPPSAYSFTYRWVRLITRRSWYIRFDNANNRWVVTQRSSRGTAAPEDDTGAANYNDPTPSSATGKVYIYDNSALAIVSDPNDNIGDYIREEKAFVYRLERQDGSTWRLLTQMNVGQIILTRRKATTGVVADDWQPIENSNLKRTLDATITEGEVRATVGGNLPIFIDPGANN
jgi:hypothetical protein